MLTNASLWGALFELFSTTLQEVLLTWFHFLSMSHILDDIIFIAPAGLPLCHQQLQCFLRIAEYTGIPIKASKTLLPMTCLPVHGIEVDTVQAQACLPQEKLCNLTQLLQVFSRNRSLPLQKLQSLIGHLSFTSKVLRPGRWNIRKLIDCICGISNPRHFVKVTGEIRHDCVVWLSFLKITMAFPCRARCAISLTLIWLLLLMPQTGDSRLFCAMNGSRLNGHLIGRGPILM